MTPSTPATIHSVPVSTARCLLTSRSRGVSYLAALTNLQLENLLRNAGLPVPQEPGLMDYAARLFMELYRLARSTPGGRKHMAKIKALQRQLVCLVLGGGQ